MRATRRPLVHATKIGAAIFFVAFAVGWLLDSTSSGSAHTSASVNFDPIWAANPTIRDGVLLSPLTTTSGQARLTASNNVWNQTPSTRESTDSTASDSSVSYSTNACNAPTGTIHFTSNQFTGSTLARTKRCSNSTTITRAIIGFDASGRTWNTSSSGSSSSSTTETDLQGVATHELGHAMGGWRANGGIDNHFSGGLCPADSSVATMCINVGPGQEIGATVYWRTLTAHDTHTIANAYSGVDSLGVFRNGNWLLNNSFDSSHDLQYSFGGSSVLPVPGDFDGDGDDTIGYRNSGSNLFKLKIGSNGGSTTTIGYGIASDDPLVGDWDCNGTDTVGIRRGNVFYLRNSNSSGSADITFGYGQASDVPIVGDFNEDGCDTITVKRGSTWYVNNQLDGSASFSFSWGSSSDTPLAADWDNDGYDEVGRRSGNSFYFKNYNSSGSGQVGPYGYGSSSDVPIMGDWNDN